MHVRMISQLFIIGVFITSINFYANFSTEKIQCVAKPGIQDKPNAASCFFLSKMNLKTVSLLLYFSVTKKKKIKQFLFINVPVYFIWL